jgi:hypothetical protein
VADDEHIHLLMKQALKVDFGRRVTYDRASSEREQEAKRLLEDELDDSAQAHAEAVAGLQSLSAG